jgi:ABC-type glycerol-3-phosphate transport system substrate-binding protein
VNLYTVAVIRNKDIFKKLGIEVDKDTQLFFIRGTAKKLDNINRKISLAPANPENTNSLVN